MLLASDVIWIHALPVISFRNINPPFESPDAFFAIQNTAFAGFVHSFPEPLIILLLIRLHSVSYHLPQFKFFGKLAAQNAKVVDKVFAALHQSGARAKGTISLNAEYKLTDSVSERCETLVRLLWTKGLPDKWMRHFVASKFDMRRL